MATVYKKCVENKPYGMLDNLPHLWTSIVSIKTSLLHCFIFQIICTSYIKFFFPVELVVVCPELCVETSCFSLYKTTSFLYSSFWLTWKYFCKYVQVNLIWRLSVTACSKAACEKIDAKLLTHKLNKPLIKLLALS